MDLFDLVAKLTLDTSEYEKGLGDAETKASGMGGSIGNALGVAGKTSVAAFGAIAGAATVAGGAVVKATGDVASYGDNIDKMSQKMGLTAEAYQEWDAVMQHSGTSMETMKASMKTLASAAEKGNDAFSALGITEDQLAKMNQQEIFEATIAGLQQIEDDTQRTYLAGQLLGRGATELGALLNTSAEDTQAMRDRVHELGGVMSDEAVKASAKYQDTLQDMTTAFDGMKRGIVSDFLPAVTQGMEGLTSIMGGDMKGGLEQLNSTFDSVISGITDKLPMLIESVSTIALALADAFLSNLPKFAETGLQVIEQLGNGIAEALPDLIVTLTESFTGVLEALTNPDNLGGILEAGIAILEGLVNGIIQALPILIDSLPVIIDNVITFVTDSIPLLIDAAVQVVMALVQALPTILEALINALPQIISSIVTGLLGMIGELVNAGIQLFLALVEGLPEAITQICDHLPELIDGLVNGILEGLPMIIDAGIQLFSALVENMPAIIEANIKAIPQLIMAIIGAIGKLTPKMIKAGIDLMAGLAKGIVQGAVKAAKAAIDAGKKVVDGVKKLFKINSPSKLFEQFGEFLDEGMAIGISDNVDKVSQAMNEMRDATTLPADELGDEWSTSTQVISTGSPVASGGSQMVTAILELDKVQLGKVVFDLNQAETQRMGVNLASGGY